MKEGSIIEYETLVGASLPDDLRSAIRACNGGRPSLKYYDLSSEKDKEFKSLLSFNRGDIENVFSCYPLDSSDKTLVPFAIDSAGNFFVLKDGKIYLWFHEVDRTVFVADSFSAFIELLHD